MTLRIVERPRHEHADPEDTCFACDGRNYLWTREGGSRVYRPCWCCDTATEGVYVVRAAAGPGLSYELPGESRSFSAAAKAARRFLALARVRVRKVRITAAHVVYLPSPETAEREKVVSVYHAPPVPTAA